MEKISNELKIYYLWLYLVVFWIFWLVFLSLLIHSRTFFSVIFSLFLIWFFLLPVIFILNSKINKKYLGILCILLIISTFWAFEKTVWIEGNYELVNLDWKKYSFNYLNNYTEKELLYTWAQMSWILWVTKEQADYVKEASKSYYENEIKLPSQIPDALFDKSNRNYVIYTPSNYNKEKVIFVIHGSCGNFMFYQKVFQKLADETWYQIITPSFWFWNWFNTWWVEMIFDTYIDLINKQKINKNTQSIMIWVSNGWTALSRMIYFDDKNIFSKIFYLSWVVEKNIFELEKFKNNAKNKEIYWIHGKVDDRIWFEYFQEADEILDFKDKLIFEDWDHFILMSKAKEIMEFVQKNI